MRSVIEKVILAERVGFALSGQKKITFARIALNSHWLFRARVPGSAPAGRPVRIFYLTILHGPNETGQRRMAERVGFEPTVPLPAHLFSRQAP